MHLLTAKEASVLLRVTPQRIYQMAREGSLPTVKVGRCVRFDKDQLRQWMERGGSPLNSEEPTDH